MLLRAGPDVNIPLGRISYFLSVVPTNFTGAMMALLARHHREAPTKKWPASPAGPSFR
jgi:hypothetical protein